MARKNLKRYDPEFKARVALEAALSGEELRQPGEGARAGPRGDVGVGRAERLVVPHLAASQRRASAAEVEHGVTEEVARREAGRCLRCDRELDCSAAAPVAGGPR